MSNVTNVFVSLRDNRDKPYFLYIPSETTPQINTTQIETNFSSFLQDSLQVSPLATGLFTTDLTPRDDVLIAVLSLLLLLAIEGIVTTLLLRTSNRTVSNFGFSVKHFVELARDFRFRSLFRTRSHRVNIKLLIFALVFLSSTFALEVLVLFLTAPSPRHVNNDTAAIRILQPITPEWIQVRFHSRVSINRACTALSLAGVEQGRTAVSSCLTSNVTGEQAQIFKEVTGSVDVTIVSDLHRYGSEHWLTFGTQSARYSARAYLSLGDGKERLMSEAMDRGKRNAEAVYHGHKLFIAYLFSSYARATKDERITAERLNQIDIVTSLPRAGSRVDVLRRPGSEPVSVPSDRFESVMRNVPAAGDAVALQYAEAVFKAAIGVSITQGDTSDLFMPDGSIRSERAPVWGENARGLNWISLLLTLIGTLLILIAMRWWLKPASTADIAGVYVKGLVGANCARAPLQIAEGERRWFRIGGGERGYQFGAETDEDWKEEDTYEAAVW